MRAGEKPRFGRRAPGPLGYAGSAMNEATRFVPHWLAWPTSALSTLGALGGAVLFFLSAVFADYELAIWGAGAFTGAAVLWFVGDMAASNRPLD